jgi:hypothetical protein
MDSSGYTPIMSASKADSNVTKVLEELLKNVKIDHTATVSKKQQQQSNPTGKKVLHIP